MKKQRCLDLAQDGEVDLVAQALSSKVRRKILSLLRKGNYTVNELTGILNLSLSTTSFHVSMLKKAQLVNISVVAGAHGSAKVVSRKQDIIEILMDDINDEDEKLSSVILNVPIGSYFDVSATNICGLADSDGIIGREDMAGAFFLPRRTNAGILWFSHGYVEYRIHNYFLYGHKAHMLNISLELCSEAPNFNMEWPSDITFWINGVELFTYTSPGDFGDRRGLLNPPWWSDYSSQYGMLHNLKIDGYGCFWDGALVSDTEIDGLGIEKGNFFSLKIGIKDTAKHKGGINIFGSTFGDYAQDIKIRVDYK